MARILKNPIGQSPAWLAILDRITNLAASDTNLLIQGERGTGKSMVAERLHFLSPRWEEAFLSLDVESFASGELEEFLFGGAGFADAELNRLDNGTLFLANIDKASLELQAKLVLLIERGKVIGKNGEETELDICLIAATTRFLPDLVKNADFSARFLDAICVDVISLPPLRERKEDILVLAEHFAVKKIKDLGESQFDGFEASAKRSLIDYDWPGNIRQLRSCVERAVINQWADDKKTNNMISQIEFDPFASDPWFSEQTQKQRKEHFSNTGFKAGFAKKETINAFKPRIAAFEKDLIKEAMLINKNHQGKAAKYLGLSYHQFRGLLRKYGFIGQG